MLQKNRQPQGGGDLSPPMGIGGFSSNLSYLTHLDGGIIMGVGDVLAGPVYGKYKSTLDATDAMTVRVVAAMSGLSNNEMLGALKQYKGRNWGTGGTMTHLANSIALAKEPAVLKSGLTSVEIFLASRIVAAPNAEKYMASGEVHESVGEMRPGGASNFTAAFSPKYRGDVLGIAGRIRERVTLPSVEDVKKVTAPDDSKRHMLAKKIVESYQHQLSTLRTGVR